MTAATADLKKGCAGCGLCSYPRRLSLNNSRKVVMRLLFRLTQRVASVWVFTLHVDKINYNGILSILSVFIFACSGLQPVQRASHGLPSGYPYAIGASYGSAHAGEALTGNKYPADKSPAGKPPAAKPPRKNPVSAVRSLEQASIFLERRDYQSAREAAQVGLEASPFYPPLWLVKGKAALALGQHSDARDAFGVCVVADPDNLEANALAFKTVLESADLDSSQKAPLLDRQIRRVSPQIFLAMLGGVILAAPDMVFKLEAFLPVWTEAGIGPELARQICEHYVRQEFQQAAELLASPEAGRLPRALRGQLNLVVGRVLPWVDDKPEALRRLAEARALRFEAAEAGRLIGLIHLSNREPGKAAAIWEEVWRGTEHPANVAQDAAAAYRRAGEPERALALLDRALGAFPNHAGLQAGKWLALHDVDLRDGALSDSGRFSRLRSYEEELEGRGARAGLGYARACLAWENGDYERYAAEERAVREYLDASAGSYMALTTLDHWARFGDWVFSAEETRDVEKLGDYAAELWQRGKYPDSLVIREAEAATGVRNLNITFYNAAVTLANDGQAAQAVMLIRRDLPRMDALDLAAFLFASERLNAARPLFAELAREGSRSPEWVSLYRAATLAQTFEGDDAEATRILEEAWRMPVPETPLALRTVSPDGDIVTNTYPRPNYAGLFVDAVERIIRAGARTGTYGALARSPALSGPARAGCEMSRGRLKFDRLEAAALMIRFGQSREGRRILEEELAENPCSPRANLYLAMDEANAGRRGRARDYLAGALAEAEGFVRLYALSWQARLNADVNGRAQWLRRAVEAAPNDNNVRQEAVEVLAEAYRFGDAVGLARIFEKRYAKNDSDFGPFVAMSYSALGKYARAVPVWREQVRRFPYSRAPLAGLAAALNRNEQPEETVRVLTAPALKYKNVEYDSLLAEAYLAMGEGQATLSWVMAGLKLSPKDRVLLRLAAGAAELLRDDPLTENYAGRYLEVDPESASMQIMYGQALLNQKKWEELRCHNLNLLRTNPLNNGALEREAERVKACEEPKKARRYGWNIDRYIIKHYFNDVSTVIRAAISAAGDGKFRHAIPTLERIMQLGPNSVTQSIIFGRLSLGKTLDAITLDEAKEKLQALYERHRFASTADLQTGPNPRMDALERIPLVVFVGRSTAEAIHRFDEYLAQVGGRAVLVFGEESLSEWTEPWPSASYLRLLAASGRWEFFLTDNQPAAFPGPTDELNDAFWLKARWLGDRYETELELQARISAEMLRLRGKAESAGIPVRGWLHPSWGDYGQRAVRQEVCASRAYLAAVRENFPLAITVVPSGYRVPWTDSARIPVRSVGAGLDTQEFIDSVHWYHPTRRAVLELAKVKSWHSQYPAAEDLFRKARCLGLDDREIAYFHARNYQFEGDVPSAICGSHETKRLDPMRDRTGQLIIDTHRLLRPLVLFEPRYTSDSDGEKYAGATASVSFHVLPRLELRASAGYQRWYDDEGTFNGTSILLGARWYFKRQNWLLAEVGATNIGGGVGTVPEGRLLWHGVYNVPKLACMNGTFDLQYTRSVVNTRKAMSRGGIFANTFTGSTTVRLDEWWETDLQASSISRTDGNHTWDLSVRPTYRVTDMPLVRVGYWGRFSNSTFDSPDYYAPQDYQSHSLVVMFRHSPTPKLTYNGLGSYGISRSRGGSWGPLMRANLAVNYRINDCVEIGGGFQYMKSQDYTLRQFGGSLAIRF